MQILLRSLNIWSICAVEDWLKHIALIRDGIWNGYDNLPCLFLSEIGKFIKHLPGGFKVKRRLIFGIGKALGELYYLAVICVLRVKKMHITGGSDGYTKLLAEGDYLAVPIPELLLILGFALPQHIGVVAYGLNFKEIVETGYFNQLLMGFAFAHGCVKFSGFTGRTHNKALPELYEQAFRHPRALFIIVHMGF